MKSEFMSVNNFFVTIMILIIYKQNQFHSFSSLLVSPYLVLQYKRCIFHKQWILLNLGLDEGVGYPLNKVKYLLHIYE